MKRIQRKPHQTGMYKVNKISCFNDKRYVFNDATKISAFGH